MSKEYIWLSFSKVVPKGEYGNIGAIVMSYEGPELSKEHVLNIAEDRGIIPEGTASVAGYPLSEEEALIYPIDHFMTRTELYKLNSVVNVRSAANLCDECEEQLNNPN